MRLAPLVSVLAAIWAIAPSAANAANGTFTQYLCFNPDTGQGVGAPPEISVTQGQQPYTLTTDCSGAVTPSSGIRFASGLPTHTSDHQVAEFTYVPASGVELAGGEIYRHWTAPQMHPSNQVLRVHGGASGRTFDAYSAEYVSWYEAEIGMYPWGSRGNASAPFAPENRVPLKIGPLGLWRVASWCDSANTGGCDTPVGSNVYRVFSSRLVLTDDSAPATSNLVGAVSEASELRGTEDVGFYASDVGAGIYRAHLQVDGVTVSTVVPDANAGRCADVNPSNADPYEFGRSAPCKGAVSVDMSLNTAAFADGEHVVKAIVEDAGGNSTVALSRRVMFRNRPADISVPAAWLPNMPAVAAEAPKGVLGLSFRLNRRSLRNGQLLRYSGAVSNHGGLRLYVDVQVRQGKRWRPVCSVRTDSAGGFACRHRFTRTFTRTRYVFRARTRSLASQATVTAPPRAVIVRPR